MSSTSSAHFKNLVGFWIIGLSNNFLYVIILSGALDLIKERRPDEHATFRLTDTNFTCSSMGTGAILTAITVPGVICKFIAPFYLYKVSFHFKFLIPLCTALISILGVVRSQEIWTMMCFVALAGVTVGIGGQVQLSMTSFFPEGALSAYASGTGGAGVFGALFYSYLTIFFEPDMVILASMLIPFTGVLSYFFLLTKPKMSQFSWRFFVVLQREITFRDKINENCSKNTALTTREKIDCIKYEVTYFNLTPFTYDQQYRMYQSLYQLGVFLGRSFINIYKTNDIIKFSFLQGVNLLLFILQVFYRPTERIWLIFGLVLFEGVVGGLAYVNAFKTVSKEVPKRFLEFAMTIGTCGDSLGILLAGILSLPIHKSVCEWIGYQNASSVSV